MTPVHVFVGRGRAALHLPIVLLLASAAGCASGDGPTGAAAQADHHHPGGAPAVDVARSLMITDLQTLEATDASGRPRFSLERVLSTIASTSGDRSMRAIDVYLRMFDTDNDRAHAFVPDGQHCDDQKDAAGNPVINGFPVECPRQEGALADVSMHDPFQSCARTGTSGCDPYTPVAIANRLDLADPGGETCGQYRIVFGKGVDQSPLETAGILDITNRTLIILEAIIPNVHPERGLAGCAPYVRQWAALSAMDDPRDRAAALDRIFFQGVAGFAPVVSFDHYDGSVDPMSGVQTGGQIRANQFMFDVVTDAQGDIGGMPWQLREYNTRRSCSGHGWRRTCRAEVRYVPVLQNPDASLFDDGNDSPRAKRFRSRKNPGGFIQRIAALAAGDLNAINVNGLDREFNGGQSTSSPNLILPPVNNPFPTSGPFPAPLDDANYDVVYARTQRKDGPLTTAIQDELDRLGSTLTPMEIVRRAQTQACAGCHMLATSQAALFGGSGDGLPPPPAPPLLPPAIADQLGGGMVWPDAARSISPIPPPGPPFINSFTQTSEEILVPLPGAAGVTCDASCTAHPESCACAWEISPALTDVFLPFRKQNMEALLSAAPGDGDDDGDDGGHGH